MKTKVISIRINKDTHERVFGTGISPSELLTELVNKQLQLCDKAYGELAEAKAKDDIRVIVDKYVNEGLSIDVLKKLYDATRKV